MLFRANEESQFAFEDSSLLENLNNGSVSY